MEDYYETLQVSQKADPEVIKAAYHRLSFKHHPDRNPGDASAEKTMKLLNAAWEVLGNPSQRSAYDSKREEAVRRAEQDNEAARRDEQTRNAVHQAQRQKEADEQAERARVAAQEKAAREREAAEERKRPETQTKRPRINEPRKNDKPRPLSLHKSPSWTETFALLLAGCGGFMFFFGAPVLLNVAANCIGVLGFTPWRISEAMQYREGLPLFVGGGLALALGLGLNIRKPCAASVPLLLSLPATVGGWLGIISTARSATSLDTNALGFLLTVAFFLLAFRHDWKKKLCSWQ